MSDDKCGKIHLVTLPGEDAATLCGLGPSQLLFLTRPGHPDSHLVTESFEEVTCQGCQQELQIRLEE